MRGTTCFAIASACSSRKPHLTPCRTDPAFSLLMTTAFAAPAPKEFNSLDEFKEILFAEPGRPWTRSTACTSFLIPAMPQWQPPHRSTTGRCTPPSTRTTPASSTRRCSCKAPAARTFNDGRYFTPCQHWRCQTPGLPGICPTYKLHPLQHQEHMYLNDCHSEAQLRRRRRWRTC